MHLGLLQARAASARWWDIGTLVTVFLLIFSFIWFWQQAFPGARALFTVILVSVLVLAHAQRAESLRDVGFRLDTAGRALLLAAPFVAIMITVSVATGDRLDSARFPPFTTAVFAVFGAILFGLAQQYVLLAFFYRRFERLLPGSATSVVATALLFAFFHLPNAFLTTVTFFAGLAAALIYRRAPNLWIIGIAHGLISYCLYYALPLEMTGGLRVGPGYYGLR